jgi:hypothetical protein
MDPKKALLMIARVVLVACMLARQEFGAGDIGAAGDSPNAVARLQALQHPFE